MTLFLVYLAGVATVVAVAFVAFRLLGLHVCDEPKDHPPRAFEADTFVDAEDIVDAHEERT